MGMDLRGARENLSTDWLRLNAYESIMTEAGMWQHTCSCMKEHLKSKRDVMKANSGTAYTPTFPKH